jgi:hypothetical protein
MGQGALGDSVQRYTGCNLLPREVTRMQQNPQIEWQTPEHEEIALNCEVASYYSGELESAE